MKRILPISSLCLLTSPVWALSPIVEFRFNDAGGKVKNTGGDTAIHGECFTSENVEDRLISDDREGVSGQLGDRAMDNSLANAMGFRAEGEGEASRGGRLELIGVEQVIDQARSLTVTFWMKASSEGIGANARLLDLVFASARKGASDGGGLSIRATSDKEGGRLAVELFTDKSGSVEKLYQSTEREAFSRSGEWFFVALTFQATKEGEPAITLYRGTSDTAVETIVHAGESPGVLIAAAKGVSAFGNAGGSISAPFQGLMDNLRIFVSSDSGDAALSPDQLEIIRQADLKNVVPKL